MPTKAQYESAVASLLASSAWINGTESEREALAQALHQGWSGLWEQIGSWWADLWDLFKEWVTPPKSGQKSVGTWFEEWWQSMFPPNLPWANGPGGPV